VHSEPASREPNAALLEVQHWGRVPFAEAHARQQRLVAERIAGERPDQLVFCEHSPVVTIGRRTPADELPEPGIETVVVERGGEATWHGPGQCVAYPVLLLAPGRRDLHRYLRDLEQVVIDVLDDLGLEAERRDGLTGVWVGDKKLCSIGVAVRRWVTWHGLALNVSCDLESFAHFRPCGLDPAVMGRVCDFATVPQDDPLLAGALERQFRSRFGCR
jgi:lipoyl(octanoyl) transferase